MRYDYNTRRRREYGGRYAPWAGAWDYPQGYDRQYRNGGHERGFARSRWQVDNGDPFGDRRSGTPIRMLRSRYRDTYDRRMLGYDEGFRGTYRARSYSEWFF